ncbi:zinc ABC transporter substrate-binding protein AztC [Rhodococcus sp. NCIMB 12038]|uniref:zinc ABC transporter substrate-binding protein AztC n=1 Tax=Rhodococcus sp. NCIMB 12038 TaxID=933800 RepID=UPI000B3CB0BB|nr:zinc ABC transporter substrate-binding protein AztC [Rhodococcus sp. NCIMB 12038]OUS93575.1 zinc ABC transporter substrate-binding protein [Rhodococcus sp. NCIMB 12038]
MRRLLPLALLAALAALPVTACMPGSSDGPVVVVTTNILGDVVQNVVGDRADVTVLMPRGADPHSFEISASDAARVERADLLVSNGLGLEEGIGNTVDTARAEGVPILQIGEAVRPIEYRSGKSSGTMDPHVWTDPDRMRDAVALIRDAVIEHVPDIDADAVRTNAEGYARELAELTARMTDRFATVPPDRRKLVTNHHVFGYLAERFGFDTIGAVIPSGTTLASPSASDLSDLAATVTAAKVPAIFVDSSQPDRLAQVLASEARVPVDVVSLFTESLGEPGSGAGTYIEMMDANSVAIVQGLT